MNTNLHPLQVYIVEDSPIMRRMLASTVEAAGGDLVGYSAAAQRAIADLSVLDPDLILIDISLDSGTGFDVLRVLQERKMVPSAVKVVLTNHANANYKDLSYRLGAEGFFDKATDTSQVLALIKALAAERRPGDRAHGPQRDRSQDRAGG